MLDDGLATNTPQVTTAVPAPMTDGPLLVCVSALGTLVGAAHHVSALAGVWYAAVELAALRAGGSRIDFAALHSHLAGLLDLGGGHGHQFGPVPVGVGRPVASGVGSVVEHLDVRDAGMRPEDTSDHLHIGGEGADGRGENGTEQFGDV